MQAFFATNRDFIICCQRAPLRPVFPLRYAAESAQIARQLQHAYITGVLSRTFKSARCRPSYRLTDFVVHNRLYVSLLSSPYIVALVTAQITTRTTSSTRRTTTTSRAASTSSIKWQVSGGVSCPHPSVTTVWPTPTGSTSLPTASLIPAGAVFDGKMSLYDRAGSTGACKGQTEGDEGDAVFVLEEGATLKNVIIGKDQAEGVHCRGSCRIENVWWDDVCEDAATFKGSGTRYVVGGGAKDASDKVFQHNGTSSRTSPAVWSAC